MLLLLLKTIHDNRCSHRTFHSGRLTPPRPMRGVSPSDPSSEPQRLPLRSKQDAGRPLRFPGINLALSARNPSLYHPIRREFVLQIIFRQGDVTGSVVASADHALSSVTLSLPLSLSLCLSICFCTCLCVSLSYTLPLCLSVAAAHPSCLPQEGGGKEGPWIETMSD